MRLPRMTTRRLMVIVAVVGVGAAIYVLFARRSVSAHAYRNRAAEHRMWEEVHRDGEKRFRDLWLDAIERRDPDAEDYRSTAVWDAARARYHAEMRRKYERAARYPWLPVAPDPPEPR